MGGGGGGGDDQKKKKIITSISSSSSFFFSYYELQLMEACYIHLNAGISLKSSCIPPVNTGSLFFFFFLFLPASLV